MRRPTCSEGWATRSIAPCSPKSNRPTPASSLFVAAQRVFRTYTAVKGESCALLLNTLRALVREALQYEELLGNLDPASGEVPRCELRAKLLEDRARDLHVAAELPAFYASKLFLDNHFRLSADRRKILYGHPEEGLADEA